MIWRGAGQHLPLTSPQPFSSRNQAGGQPKNRMNENRIKQQIVATLEKLEFCRQELPVLKNEYRLSIKTGPAVLPLFVALNALSNCERLIIRLEHQAIDLSSELLSSDDLSYVEYANQLIDKLTEVEA